MSYAFVMLLVSSTLGSAFASRWSKLLRMLSIVPLYVAFVILYLFVDDQVAQDRDEYYRWYLDAHNLVLDHDRRDVVFSIFLNILPSSLGPSEFGVVLSGIVFLLLACVIGMLALRKIISWDHVPLVLLAIFFDRLFLDHVLNTTRGSIAILLFLLGILAVSHFGRLLLWVVALGIHARLFVIFLGLYSSLALIRRYPILLRLALLVGIGLFVFRVASGHSPFADLTFLNALIESIESESVRRGFTAVSEPELTLSLTLQIFLGFVYPALIIWLTAKQPTGYDPALKQEPSSDSLLRLAFVAMAIGLAIYPDLSLSQRIFFVPILILPAFLSLNKLKGLVLLKLLFFAFYLPMHMG